MNRPHDCTEPVNVKRKKEDFSTNAQEDESQMTLQVLRGMVASPYSQWARNSLSPSKESADTPSSILVSLPSYHANLASTVGAAVNVLCSVVGEQEIIHSINTIQDLNSTLTRHQASQHVRNVVNEMTQCATMCSNISALLSSKSSDESTTLASQLTHAFSTVSGGMPRL